MCPGNTSWRSLRICLTVSLLLVSDVIDVPVSPSSLITELCDVFLLSPFLSPKSVHIVVQIRGKR